MLFWEKKTYSVNYMLFISTSLLFQFLKTIFYWNSGYQHPPAELEWRWWLSTVICRTLMIWIKNDTTFVDARWCDVPWSTLAFPNSSPNDSPRNVRPWLPIYSPFKYKWTRYRLHMLPVIDKQVPRYVLSNDIGPSHMEHVYTHNCNTHTLSSQTSCESARLTQISFIAMGRV